MEKRKPMIQSNRLKWSVLMNVLKNVRSVWEGHITLMQLKLEFFAATLKINDYGKSFNYY